MDGMHAADLTTLLKTKSDASLGALARTGLTYTKASSAMPSDIGLGLTTTGCGQTRENKSAARLVLNKAQILEIGRFPISSIFYGTQLLSASGQSPTVDKTTINFDSFLVYISRLPGYFHAGLHAKIQFLESCRFIELCQLLGWL